MKTRYIIVTAIVSLGLFVWFKDLLKQRRATKNPQEEMATLRPLHAFNEMEVLNRAGRHGWHSVDYGVLFHVVARDDRQWEHVRTARRKAPYGEGWTQVGDGWGWWKYYARPLDTQALPADEFTSGLPQTG